MKCPNSVVRVRRFDTRIVLLLVLLFLLPVVVAEAGRAGPMIPLSYYGEIGCAHCDTFVDEDLKRLTQTYDIDFAPRTRDILSSEWYAECRRRLADMNREFRVFPVLFIGNNAYQGNKAIDE
jgi:hypothetical protein